MCHTAAVQGMKHYRPAEQPWSLQQLLPLCADLSPLAQYPPHYHMQAFVHVFIRLGFHSGIFTILYAL